MLHLVLAESSLELVPRELWSHPSVSKPAKVRGKPPGELLLEDGMHHSAMRQAAKKGRFPDMERRGRPDVVHTALLVALESRLNKQGGLRVWVHTRHDELIEIRPDTRLQRAQNRFYGLVESLLLHGAVPQGHPEPLLQVHPDTDLAGAIARTGATRVVMMDEAAPDDDLDAALAPAAEGLDVAVVIGGFAHGRIQSDLSTLAVPVQTVSLGPDLLTVWTVASEVIVTTQRLRSRATA